MKWPYQHNFNAVRSGEKHTEHHHACKTPCTLFYRVWYTRLATATTTTALHVAVREKGIAGEGSEKLLIGLR